MHYSRKIHGASSPESLYSVTVVFQHAAQLHVKSVSWRADYDGAHDIDVVGAVLEYSVCRFANSTQMVDIVDAS
jgi:hypothetical protein